MIIIASAIFFVQLMMLFLIMYLGWKLTHRPRRPRPMNMRRITHRDCG